MLNFSSQLAQPHQRSVLKTPKKKIPGSISGYTCRLRRSELSVFFSERSPRTAHPLQVHVSQADKWLQSNNPTQSNPSRFAKVLMYVTLLDFFKIKVFLRGLKNRKVPIQSVSYKYYL